MKKNFYKEHLQWLQPKEGEVCVSVIVPASISFGEKEVTLNAVEAAIDEARSVLDEKDDKTVAATILRKLNELKNTIDDSKPVEGIGLFVSPTINKRVDFHFPVEKQVMVGEGFYLRNWLYQLYFSQPYHVLLLSENGTKIFRGKFTELEEIAFHQLPQPHLQEYEYSTPSRGSSYTGHAFTKAFENDKAQVEQERLEAYVKTLVTYLEKELRPRLPIVVAGAEKTLSFYQHRKHRQTIAGMLHGNFFHVTAHELGQLTWKAMQSFLFQKQTELLQEFEEKMGDELATDNISEIWNAVNEGRARLLLVEKDFRVKGYLAKNASELTLEKPAANAKEIPDIVEQLIWNLSKKGGEVLLLDNGMLARHNRMGAITRYR